MDVTSNRGTERRRSEDQANDHDDDIPDMITYASDRDSTDMLI
jgi:hypothetical protein